jgi:hypothetical protein
MFVVPGIHLGKAERPNITAADMIGKKRQKTLGAEIIIHAKDVDSINPNLAGIAGGSTSTILFRGP